MGKLILTDRKDGDETFADVQERLKKAARKCMNTRDELGNIIRWAVTPEWQEKGREVTMIWPYKKVS